MCHIIGNLKRFVILGLALAELVDGFNGHADFVFDVKGANS